MCKPKIGRRTWLCYLGAVLLASAVPIFNAAGSAEAAQSVAATKNKKKKSTSKRKAISAPRAQTAPTPDRIREIQSGLVREGALSGEPTGKWDSATIEAMKKYQSDNGLNPTGKIDALTLQKLGLGSEIAGKGAPVPPVSSSPAPSNLVQ